ncbi:MAG TPA: sigma-70 family RNA polymerase sigma factor [Jatrophihabitans sp.]
MTGDPEAESRLRALFEAHSRQVFAYAARHSDPNTAQDVVGEVFLVAWRRIEDVPENPLPWLLVTARNVLHNVSRSVGRQRRLADAMVSVERLAARVPAAEETALRRAEMLGALGQLSSAEREAVLLIAWDGLATADAAAVAGCSRRAFEVRLSRARARLDRLLSTSRPVPLNEVAR